MATSTSTSSSFIPAPPLSPALDDMVSPRVFNTTGEGVGEGGREEGQESEEEKQRRFDGPVRRTVLTIMQALEAMEEGGEEMEEEWRLAGMPKKKEGLHEDEQGLRHDGDDDGGEYDIPLPLPVDTR